MACVGLTACGGSESIFLGLPDSFPSGAVLVAIDRPDSSLEIRAYSSPPISIEIGDALVDNVGLTLVAFDRPLDELGSSPGRLEPVSGLADTIEDLGPSATYLTTSEGGAFIPFTEGTASPDVLEFPIRADDPCPVFGEERVLGLPEGLEPRALELEDGTALVHTDTALAHIAEDGSFVTWSSTTGASINAVAQREGQVFMLASDGLYELSTSNALEARRIEALTTDLAGEELDSLYVISVEPRVELLSLSTSGALLRYQDGAWSDVIRAGSEIKREDVLDQPSLFAVEDGAIIGIQASMTAVVELRGTTARFVTPDNLHKGFVATAETERSGRLIVDTFDGKFYRYNRGGTWSPYFDSGAADVYSMVPRKDGFVVASDKKPVQAVFPERGIVCPPATIGSYARLKEIIDVNGRLLVGGRLIAGLAAWSWITPPVEP